MIPRLAAVAILIVCAGSCGPQERTAAPAATAAPPMPTEIVAASPEPTAPPVTPTPTAAPELVVPTFAAPTATPTPEPLPMEDRWETARKLIEPKLPPLVKQADALDRKFEDYQLCYERYQRRRWPASGQGREWFAVLAPGTALAWRDDWTFLVPGDATYCREAWAELAKQARAAAESLDDLENQARRAGVLPGHLRKMLEQHRLYR